MAGGKIGSLAREIAERAADTLRLELVDVEYIKEGSNYVLRIFIDKEGGVSTDDCEKLSRMVERTLDELDPIENHYSLEVSSPGLDRPLKKDSDFVKFKGKDVDIKLYKAKNGKKKYDGILNGLENGIIYINDYDGCILEFERKEVASIRLKVIF